MPSTTGSSGLRGPTPPSALNVISVLLRGLVFGLVQHPALLDEVVARRGEHVDPLVPAVVDSTSGVDVSRRDERDRGAGDLDVRVRTPVPHALGPGPPYVVDIVASERDRGLLEVVVRLRGELVRVTRSVLWGKPVAGQGAGQVEPSRAA